MQEFASGNRLKIVSLTPWDTRFGYFRLSDTILQYHIHIPSCVYFNEDVWCYNYQLHSMLTSLRCKSSIIKFEVVIASHITWVKYEEHK